MIYQFITYSNCIGNPKQSHPLYPLSLKAHKTSVFQIKTAAASLSLSHHSYYRIFFFQTLGLHLFLYSWPCTWYPSSGRTGYLRGAREHCLQGQGGHGNDSLDFHIICNTSVNCCGGYFYMR